MKPGDLTIIYYTSNRENPDFEKRVRDVLVKSNAGRYPIVSVSQKPIDFGENICVGDDIGANDHNLYRQVQIACQAAKTPFVASAEADCLYPPDYFELEPRGLDKVYRYDNVWILRQYRSFFFKKQWCEGAQIAGREYYIDLISKEMEDEPKWKQGYYQINPFRDINKQFEWYGGPIAVVSIKTGNGLRGNSSATNKYVKTLPHWGTTRIVRGKLF